MASTELGGPKQYAIKRFLGELEEGVGVLRAVIVDENSLLVVMDSVEFIIDFPSTHFVQQARKELLPYIGKKIGVFRDTDATKPLRIRPATPLGEAKTGDHQR